MILSRDLAVIALPSCRGAHVLDHQTDASLMYDAHKKSALVAYLLWWFLGYFGAHRFYLGATVSGVIMLVLFLVSLCLTLAYVGLIGILAVAIWWIVDAILIPGMVTEYNVRLIKTMR
jgi:TM2 domain-containing membrane protein YozV